MRLIFGDACFRELSCMTVLLTGETENGVGSSTNAQKLAPPSWQMYVEEEELGFRQQNKMLDTR